MCAISQVIVERTTQHKGGGWKRVCYYQKCECIQCVLMKQLMEAMTKEDEGQETLTLDMWQEKFHVPGNESKDVIEFLKQNRRDEMCYKNCECRDCKLAVKHIQYLVQNPEKTAWCQLTLIGGIATGKDFHILNFTLGDRVRNRIHRGRCLARCSKLIAQFLEFATTLFR